MAEISTLNGYKIKDKKAVRFYDTVELMKNDTALRSGMHIKTKGYYFINDNGGAEYYITSEQSATEYQEELNNNLYATLINDSKMYIEKFGAKINDNTFDNGVIFNKIIDFYKDKNTTIILQNGVYYFDTCILYSGNLKLHGQENTTFIFKNADSGYLFSSTDDNISRYIEIKNITIKMESKIFGTGLTYEQGTAFRVFNAKNSLIENVHILNNVADNTCNGFWLRENCDNVTLRNCSTELMHGNLVGGSLWLWTYHSESVLKNILVENCSFKQNTVDEIISRWGQGTSYNIRVLNSVITEENNYNKVMSINFRDNTTDTYLVNNIFNINGKIRSFISLTNSDNNNYILNNTFNINVDSLESQHKAISVLGTNAKILGNTFNSNDNIIDYLIEQIGGNILFDNNIVNNCSNGIVTFTRDSINGNIIISNNKIKVKKYIARFNNSTNNLAKIDNNIIDLTDTSDVTKVLYFTRQSGENTGSFGYVQNNVIYGETLAIVQGVGYSNFSIRNNDIKAITLDLVLRSDETYSITMNTAIFENNNLIATTLNDLVNIGTSATKRVFNNNYINGIDITEIASDVTPSTSPYFNIFRRLVPTYQVFNAQSSSILGYKKQNDSSTYTVINIS